MPSTILVIVHQETSQAGLVGDLLTAKGYALELRCPALGDPLPHDLTGYAGVIVFGGPASANDAEPFIQTELDWLPTVLAAEVPYLGICLGAQLLARALGAAVAPHPEGYTEVGYYPIRATAAGEVLFPAELQVYHFHKEGFELPAGAKLLATGDRFSNQAFRYGSCAYAVQFHPEITAPMIDFWTTSGAHLLTTPGAQDRDTHFQKHAVYGSAVTAWLDTFLTYWLAAA